jgi:hypothetical protein
MQMSCWLQVFTDLNCKRNLVPTVKENADVLSTEKAVFGCKTKQKNILSLIPHWAVNIAKKAKIRKKQQIRSCSQEKKNAKSSLLKY